MTTDLTNFKNLKMQQLDDMYKGEYNNMVNLYNKNYNNIMNNIRITIVTKNSLIENLNKQFVDIYNKLNDKYAKLVSALMSLTRVPDAPVAKIVQEEKSQVNESQQQQTVQKPQIPQLPPKVEIMKPINKKALLIGINYYNTQNQLNGCINDVNNMKTKLIERGFSDKNIILLTDNSKSKKKPTRNNIITEFTNLLKNGKEGDLLYFHYSGHGSSILDNNKDELDGCDELFVSCDMYGITDDELKTIINSNLKKDVTLVVFSDCCHSGSILDLKYQYLDTTQNDNLVINESYNETNGNVIMISGCQDNQTSADAKINNEYQGALTNALLNILNKNSNISWNLLIKKMRSLLKESKFEQIPQLSSGKNININSNICF